MIKDILKQFNEFDHDDIIFKMTYKEQYPGLPYDVALKLKLEEEYLDVLFHGLTKTNLHESKKN